MISYGVNYKRERQLKERQQL